ncbi:Metallo-beta-lactamase [Parasponia andersonii]|uniref:Metallo-beta-lactamase n=1 Tax=Parasponia andersonii TaxID=3476 RepID=A0A2P5DHC9_PARAD|nr:Metallo-beta-lactamase [Parasponia andersonii]
MAALNLTPNGDWSTPPSMAGSALIFLGTGCSSAVPNARCLIQPSDPPCSVCSQALSIPPDQNPNYRCNTSLLIDYCQSDGNTHSYVLIDVGKTFREQVLRWFSLYKIPRVDSIILTHEHADAVLGLDDIRAIQPQSPTNDIDPTPIYLTEFAMKRAGVLTIEISLCAGPRTSLKIFKALWISTQEEFLLDIWPFSSALKICCPLAGSYLLFIAEKFPYLVQKKLKEGQEVRRVAQLNWRIIEGNCEKSFVASGLQFIPLPVMHGEDYICLGFLFGQQSRVAYISDVSRFIASTEYVISKDGAGQLDLLILDSLYKKGSHNVHFCLPQTLEALKRICPKRALLIGMTHEFDHHKDNEFLAEWSRGEGIQVQLAHDGLRIPMEL